MKIDWTTTVSDGLGRNTWIHKEDHYRFIITKVDSKVYWLHQNSGFIGTFSSLNKAQKIVELILKG